MNVWDIAAGDHPHYSVPEHKIPMEARTVASTAPAQWMTLPPEEENATNVRVHTQFHLTANEEFRNAWRAMQRVWFEIPQNCRFLGIEPSIPPQTHCLVTFHRPARPRSVLRAVEAVYFIQSNAIVWPAPLSTIESEVRNIHSSHNQNVPLRLAGTASYEQGVVFLWLGTRTYGFTGGDDVPCMRTIESLAPIVNENRYPTRLLASRSQQVEQPILEPLPDGRIGVAEKFEVPDASSPRILRIRKRQ